MQKEETYIDGKRDMGLFYAKGRNQQPALLGFSDSDLAGDLDSRKSTPGR
jgi:hypothetical protein